MASNYRIANSFPLSAKGANPTRALPRCFLATKYCTILNGSSCGVENPMTLPVRQLGPFQVSAIGLGCMNLSHAYGTPPPIEQSAAVVHRAIDLGINHLDTAALY